MLHLERPLALIGLTGAGKTSVAQCLGERLGTAVADLDALVEADSGLSVRELFEREGEPSFRRRERAALARALAAGAGVLACGGGLVESAEARDLLKTRCRTVWLEVSPAEAARRLGAHAAERPLLSGRPLEKRLTELLAARAPHYRQVADFRVATDGQDPDQVAEAVLAACGATRS
jgi:shikimate kinase